MNFFEINIRKEVFFNICSTAIPEKGKLSLKLQGKWYTEFTKQINLIEEIETELQSSFARLNPQPKRSNVVYFNSKLVCKQCIVQYSVSLQSNPVDNNNEYITFQVTRINEHHHNQVTQIRGDKRKDVSNIVKSQFNASSKAYCDALESRDLENIPSAQVILKIVSEEMSEISTCWITNVICAGDMARQIVTGNYIHGILQTLTVFPYFYMNIHTELQIRAINLVEASKRILHANATGGLTKVDKRMFDYGQILNYAFLLKNLEFLDVESVPLAEVSTSRHDTYMLGEMFQLLKFNYNKIFKKLLTFRLIVIDFSWATIHAALKHLNSQTLLEYINNVYQISKETDLKEYNLLLKQYDCSWLASCCTQTFARFTKALLASKVFCPKDKEGFHFAVYCFSLLLNTVDLNATIAIFNQICILFMSEIITSQVIAARKFLEDCLAERPADIQQVKEIIRKIFLVNLDEDEEELVCGFELDNLEIENSSSKTIKSQSVFGKIFRNIAANYSSLTTDDNSSYLLPNIYYKPAFVIFLNGVYMPYIGIWGSYPMRGLGVTRITNGTIEKYWETRKSYISSAIYPAQYLIKASELMIEQAKSKKNDKEDLDDPKEFTFAKGTNKKIKILDDTQPLIKQEELQKHNFLAISPRLPQSPTLSTQSLLTKIF